MSNSFLSALSDLCVFQREFDENEVDPYHGQQDKRPEPEAMDLPEDLNLDQDDEAGDDGEGEGNGESCRSMNTKQCMLLGNQAWCNCSAMH